MIGARLGSYQVTAKLGQGGMGEVWRAEDTRLGREVALKVLPAEFAQDAERLARFEREAKVLASLNHPNIAHLYGLETASSASDASGRGTGAGTEELTFLVMELVEGEGLDEMIARGPVPVDDAIPIALQIAEALEAAHEAGIVHRDLKPANVKVRSDGTVKVLDFGLAKAWEEGDGADLSLSPTLTRHATAAGVILGTAAYMAPEQARGKPVDRRADIWAFGVVLWEMLTGRKLFGGDTVTDVLASVLKEAPDLDALPADTPVALRRLVARCLAHDARQRLQWIGDARLELAEAAGGESAAAASVVPQGATSRWRERLAWATALLVLGVASTPWLRSPEEVEPPLTRFSIGLGADRTLSFIDQPILAFSPDGRTLAVTASDDDAARDVILLRRLDQSEPEKLDGTVGTGEMFFSPDGMSIAFFADGKLKRSSTRGGSVVTLADAPNPRGGVWLPDGTIVYSPEYATGMWRVPETGGVPEELIAIDAERGERTFRFPHATPDGEIVLFTVGTLDSPNNYEDATIDAYSLRTGARRTVIRRATMARFADRDRIIFARSGDLYAIDFDADRLETVGDAVLVIEDVGGDPSSGAAYFSIAADGSIAWLAGAVTASDALLTIVDTTGDAGRLPITPRGFYQPRFSPDGTRLAFTIGEGVSGVAGDVWVYTLASQSLSRLTFEGNALYPAWTPDGRRIAFLRYLDEAEIFTTAADGSSSPERFTGGEPVALFPESFSPDGQTLAYTRIGATSDIFLVTRGEEPRLFEPQASAPAISPDGRWIAYSSPGAGTSSVFIRPVAGDGKWQVSPGLGAYPRWSRDGRRLFYIDIGISKRPLMSVDVLPGDSFRAGSPRVAIESLGGTYVTSTAPASNWDVAPSGDRFVFVEFERGSWATSRIEVALNWSRHLEITDR